MLQASMLAAALVMSVRAGAETAEERLNLLAGRFVDETLAYDPTLAYEAGLATTVNDRLPDRSPAAISAFESIEQRDLAALDGIDRSALPPRSQATYANLREKLESDLELRICRIELWNVNHFDGWQSALADVAAAQPVGTEDARRQALKRWASLPVFIDTEIANLKRGLELGYSAPKSVVRRVIGQMDSLSRSAPEDSPFFSPAARAGDPDFKTAFRRLIAEHINPAFARYRDFLKSDYLARARTGVAISDLPDGSACYRAFLRSETTLKLSPEEVFRLGQRTVAANSSDVLRLGRRYYGTTSIAATLAAATSARQEHFASSDELLTFSRTFLARAKARTAASLITRLPSQDVIIEPERAFEESAGVSSHLDPQPDPSRPAVYRIQLGNWASETRGEAEITVAHETLPGHHLQIALAREIGAPSRLARLISLPAYQEGWARYAEGLAEEGSIYDRPSAAILRRIWPARGMVVDPGLHAFHWTREEAVRYLVSTGRYTTQSADDMVDRIAVMPAQLTAYDSGALQIRALREEAEQALGKHFDLKAFNNVLLDEGVVPLGELRRHVLAWLSKEGHDARAHQAPQGRGPR
jgi:uncharacterized protein (DUF885 family)